MKRGFITVEVCIVAAFIVLLVTAIFYALHYERTEMPAAYAAWVKQTDNPKKLTYDEWRSLMRANERQRDTAYVPMFVPMDTGWR
jgi:quinol-cytochrome oxidoreductase complex cytochrome b subunit